MSAPPDSTSERDASCESAESDHDPLVGRLISRRYRILELIATGGMGAVYLGEHVHMRKRVAIKLLLPEAAAMPQLMGRFEREAIAGAHVSHPHVAAATDFGQEPDGVQFLVLEYVRGETLASEIKKGPLEPERALRIARELASALAAVHEKDIFHRDVKPGNVILSQADGDAAKLVDFGLAKVQVDRLSTVEGDEQLAVAHRALTLVGTVFGTVSYMPPEIVRGMEHLDARADLYALGVTLYEMLAGVPPFSGKSEAELFHAIATQAPPPLAAQPGVSAAVDAVVMRLLAKQPEDRYQSAAELLAALDAAAGARDAPKGGTALARAIEVSQTQLARACGAVLTSSQKFTHWLACELERVPLPRRPRFVRRLVRANPLVLLVPPLLVLFTVALVWAVSSDDDESNPLVSATQAAPSSEQAAAPTEIDGVDASGWKARIWQSAEAKNYASGADALVALAKLDASHFAEPRTKAAAVAVTVGIAFEQNEQADAVFGVLTHDLDQAGLEILYEIVRSKAGTKAYERAVAALRDPAVAGRASPALSVAFELRRASCEGKRELFARAAREGDERVLTELKVLKYAKCRRKLDPCCFQGDASLAEAIETLGARLGASPEP